MALLKRTENVAGVVTTEEWDVDPVRLIGVGIALGAAKGLWEWTSHQFSKLARRS